MFNDRFGLTNAVLEGRKTMTRRIVSQYFLDKVKKYQEEYFANTLDHISTEDAIINMIGPERLFYNSFKIGDVVAIAQCYNQIGLSPLMYCEVPNEYGGTRDGSFDELAGWTNKMFVKAELMPHHIKITNIRVEHLQVISDDDCLREGVVNNTIGYYVDGLKCKDLEEEAHIEMKNGKTLKLFPTPRESFAALIDKVSGKGTWDSNPLVWVYGFELVD